MITESLPQIETTIILAKLYLSKLVKEKTQIGLSAFNKARVIKG